VYDSPSSLYNRRGGPSSTGGSLPSFEKSLSLDTLGERKDCAAQPRPKTWDTSKDTQCWRKRPLGRHF